MNKHFIQVTNGLLPVAVLALLAIAFIAGQARTNLPGQVSTGFATIAPSLAEQVFSAETLRSVDSLPQVVATFMALPAEIELTVTVLGRVAKTNGGGETPAASQ